MPLESTYPVGGRASGHGTTIETTATGDTLIADPAHGSFLPVPVAVLTPVGRSEPRPFRTAPVPNRAPVRRMSSDLQSLR
ncbi:hypothetical protein D8S78_21515 [Natrialba swarupiae]|nr:hypothetical protein [Natrialba swarupiae]